MSAWKRVNQFLDRRQVLEGMSPILSVHQSHRTESDLRNPTFVFGTFVDTTDVLHCVTYNTWGLQ